MWDYCLAPEQAFPAAVEETYGIIAYAFDHAEELGIDPQKIVLAGHSAGGNLVAAALIKDAEAHHLKPCCALFEYFPVDNTVDPVNRLSPELRADEFWVKRAQTEKLYTDFYVDDADPADPLCSPLKADETALAAFPGCLILSAGEDSLREDTRGFCTASDQGRCLRDSAANPGSHARVHDKPYSRLGARTQKTYPVLPGTFEGG